MGWVAWVKVTSVVTGLNNALIYILESRQGKLKLDVLLLLSTEKSVMTIWFLLIWDLGVFHNQDEHVYLFDRIVEN